MPRLRIFFRIYCITIFLWTGVLLGLCKKGRFVFFFVLLLLLLVSFLGWSHSQLRIFLLLLLFLFLLPFLFACIPRDSLFGHFITLAREQITRWGCPDFNRGRQVFRKNSRISRLLLSRARPSPKPGILSKLDYSPL